MASVAEPVFDANEGTLVLGGARLVFHCHHYNVFLQRSLEDAVGQRAVALERVAAAEAARSMLGGVFAKTPDADIASRLATAARIFGSLGFGRADVSGLGAYGGLVRVKPSHYGIGWRAKFGEATRPIDHLTAGFFRGALAAAAGHAPERVTVEVVSDAGASEGASTELRIGVR